MRGNKQIKYEGYMELCYLHPNYFKEDLDAIIKNLTDEQEKINTIFSFVKSKVKA